MNPEGPRILSWTGRAWPEGLDRTRFEFGVLESASDTRFVWGEELEGAQPEKYDSGALSGTDCEVRWRRKRGGAIHIVVIEDRPEGWPEGAESESLLRVTAAKEGLSDRVILWGEASGANAWYESRVPQKLTCYPPKFSEKRVAALLAHYRLEVKTPLPQRKSETREVPISRCRGLVVAKRTED